MKWIKYILMVIVIIAVTLFVAVRSMILEPPLIENKDVLQSSVIHVNDSLSLCNDNWLKMNEGGISEMYISGSPFEMGVQNGMLTQELASRQEAYFFDFISSLIPSKATLQYLKYFISYFNKDLDEYIPLNLRKEIYGISLFASDDYDFVGEKYHRILNYHAAHDIGHTIQNMNLVNCTAFSVQNELTNDSSLIIGRNLDFSAGDDFARNKLVVFCEPDSGYNFAYVSWGGMIGVLSGMNEHGLTITLNSAKSGIPLSAKTPVSLISREVLQYAKTIDEAYNIIQSYDSFVSESFFIGSAVDKKAVVIEKSLDAVAIYDSKESKLVLTNHFQSDELKDTELNLESIEEGCTMYRMQRTHELIDGYEHLDVNKVVGILRDKNGMSDRSIGIGNEAAVNQLICHHSIVFKPEEKLMWVSSFPYQENNYVAYDLDKVFSNDFNVEKDAVSIDSLKIEASAFYQGNGVETIWRYRALLNTIKANLDSESMPVLDTGAIEAIVEQNKDFYYTFYILGQYFEKIGAADTALAYYEQSLNCKIPRMVDREQVLKRIEGIKNEHDNK
ncbi:C45 family autoproteolytic acyltransferase/hydolase [Carboxylicivirga sp. RSCT41]|uniref:C45 family autoproteolytic acyltransferase/hydolase n=1 Tax=Carboxylicivirga agarovorans TaxID=3417570 RepID=UPI003D34D271